MTGPFLIMLFWLTVGHVLADAPLQPKGLSRAKQRRRPEGANGRWVWALSAHSMLHAGAVALITGSVTIGMMEFVAHWMIDWAKGEGLFQIDADQVLHIACKIAWVYIALHWAMP